MKGTSRQIYGKYSEDDEYPEHGTMNGFVADAIMHNATWRKAPMTCFNPHKIPALSTLVKEFAVFDRWFSSVPGPSQMNRLFLHSATSYGDIEHDNNKFLRGYPQKTIFHSMEDAGKFKNSRELTEIQDYPGIFTWNQQPLLCFSNK